MTERAIQCFLDQTYQGAMLYVYDTGEKPFREDAVSSSMVRRLHCHSGAKIIAHWDSDDWYDSTYLDTQVERLLSRRGGGVGCVGFRDAVFYDTRAKEAWAYSNPVESYCIGASMCYWASCWERVQFEHTSKGEDSRWIRNVRSVGFLTDVERPSMIATVHDSNTSTHESFLRRIDPQDTSWRRAEAFDQYCAERIK
jgi:hypothetical protein